MIAIAVGQTMTKYMHALLDPIFACGLSDALTQALVDMAHYIPPARQTIQEKLLDLLSTVLCGRPFQTLGSPNANSVSPSFLRDYRDGQTVEHTEAEIALALQTLGSFDFSGKQDAFHIHEMGTEAGHAEAEQVIPASSVSKRKIERGSLEDYDCMIRHCSDPEHEHSTFSTLR